MYKQHPVLLLVVRLVLILVIVGPPAALPAMAAAKTSSSTSLVQGRSESLDAYLRRVATVAPDVFQQASLAAVQDAFNGRLPETTGDHAMETQIAHYLHLAATDSPMDGTKTGTSSAVRDDAYLWNDTLTDQQTATNSSWQLTARPGGDTAAFAHDMDQMVRAPATEAQAEAAPDAAIPARLIGPPHSISAQAQTAPSESGSVAPATDAAAPAPVAAAPASFIAPLVPTYDELFEQQVQAHVAQATATSRANPVVTTQQAKSRRADLGLRVTAPVTATYEDVITYTVTVTNRGPANVSNVELTQQLPANGEFDSDVDTCKKGDDDETVVCAIGVLSATKSISLRIPVTMKGSDTVTSTFTIKDLGGVVDPNGKNNQRNAATTIIAPDRETRTVGSVVIVANEFKTVAGEVEASGAVKIGFVNDENENEFLLKLDDEGSISWTVGGEELNGEGTLAQVEGDFDLFEGKFTIDASEDAPKIVPEDTTSNEIEDIAGFKLVGKPEITEVFVISGTATLSATISLAQSGVMTDTQEVIEGAIEPGGAIEATIEEFEATIAGLEITVKDADFSKDRIAIKQATVALPLTLGGSTGIISQIEITATSINFGGVGLKVPLPPFYPAGRPITGTNAFTPTFSFTDNTATIKYEKKLFGLQVNSTLLLALPDNNQKIPVELKVDESGKMEGTIKQIDLKIVGQLLTMKQVKVTSTGLTVKEASLTISRETVKEDKPKTEAPKTAGTAADKPAKPNTKNTLTIVVKNVTIDKDGLQIGSAGVSNTFPDFKVGDVATFTKLTFGVTVNNPTGKASFEFTIKGTLKINLKGNEQSVAISAKIDKSGKFSGKLDALALTIAKSKLDLKEVDFNSERFTAGSASLTLPSYLAGTTVTVTKVVIDREGLSFGDATVKIPVEFTIGKDGDEPSPKNSIVVKGNLSLLLAADRTYGFAIEGTVTIKLASQSASATGSFRMDTTGEVRGSIESFELTIAGLTLGVKNATIEDGVLKAKEAKLSIPESWGGLSATVYGVEVSKQRFSISGGAFKLPEIKVGDMRLALEGSFKEEDGQYIIAAGGTLKLPNLAGGCGGIGVSVELATGASGKDSAVMTLAPLDLSSAQAVALRKASVSLQCNITLGTSGFELTAITGSIALDDNTTRLDINAKIESQFRVGPYNAVTADGGMYMEYVKNPYKFEIGIGASMKIFSMFEAARANASMRFADGDVPFIFKAELNIDAVIAKGNLKLTAWTSNGDFHLVGRIYGSVGVREGALVNKCVRFLGCLTIPSSDLFIDANIEFGEFKYGDGSTWGLKAGIEFFGSTYGVYVNTDGDFKLGNVDDYRTIDPPSLLRARDLDRLAKSRQLNSATLSTEDRDILNSYHFTPNGSLTVDVADFQKPGDLVINTLFSEADASIPFTVVRPDGLRFSTSNTPGNVTIARSTQPAQDEAGNPIPGAAPVIQTSINITDAMLGQWQIEIGGEPAQPYLVDVIGTVYGPPVEKLKATPQDTSNIVALDWQQTAPLSSTVVIYATQQPITSTASYTDTQTFTRPDGTVGTRAETVDVGVVTQYTGLPVAEYNVASGTQRVTQQLNLDDLKTGSYSLWLEVNDGRNAPTRQYFPGKVSVYHTWDDAWTANVRLTPQQGALAVAWDAHPNPDADGYDIEVIGANDTYVVDAGEALSETITGLSAQETYTVTVQAYNVRTDLVSASEAASASPQRAPFTLRAGLSALTVQGGSRATAPLTVTAQLDPYPEPVFLSIADAPDGMDVALSTDILTPTVRGSRVSLVVTPTTTLPDGTYPVTIEAAGSGDVRSVTIPVTVKAPNFTPRTSATSLVLPFYSSRSVGINAAFRNGARGPVEVEMLSIPAGIDWSFDTNTFTPGTRATLTVTDTGLTAFGDYEIVLEATDYLNSYEIVLPLTLTGVSLDVDGDSRAVLNEETAIFPIELDAFGWNKPVALSFDDAAVGDQFIVNIGQPTTDVPSTFDVEITPLLDTPPGIYTLPLRAISGGISETLDLFVTVQDDPDATDVLMDYELPDSDFLVAGEVVTYTLVPQNISANPAMDVAVFDTLVHEGYASVVENGGCDVQEDDGATTLSCALGDIDPDTTAAPTVVEYAIASDAPDGLLLTQEGEAVVQDTSVHTETSTLDNIFTAEYTVVRESDLALAVAATPATAGDVMTMTATLENLGPSDADDTLIDFYLPSGVSLVGDTVGCTQDDQFVQCAVGTLPVGANVDVFVAFEIDPSYRGSIDTLIEASSASQEIRSDDNFVELVGTVAAAASLDVAVTSDTRRFNEGDLVPYEVTITNNGPSTATDIAAQLSTPYTAYVEDVLIGSERTTLEQLTILPGETVTATVAVRTLEDDHDEPMIVEVDADATEAPVASAASTQVRVLNVAPSATISGTLVLDEGEIGVLSASTADPGGNYDAFEIAWDLDDDGAFDDSQEPAVRFDARNIDGPTTRRVRVRVTDDEGGMTIARTIVTIRNVAPTVTTGLPQTQRYDTAFTVPFEAFDTISTDMRTAQVDWGDGTRSSVALQSGGADEQATHTYNRIGTFTATICANDNDQGQGCAEVVLNATCRDNGLLAYAKVVDGTLMLTLHNGSGTVAIPAGLPFTLYNGDQPLATIQLPASLAVGGSTVVTLENIDVEVGTTLRLAVDDDGSGAKTTDLCSGSVGVPVQRITQVFLPLVHAGASEVAIAPLLAETITEQPVETGAIFRTESLTVPATLPTGGTFYLSSIPNGLQPSRVDDRVTLKVDGVEVFQYTYGLPPNGAARGGDRPYIVRPAVVTIPAPAMARMAGRRVTMELSDVYGVFQSASPLYIVWSDR